MRSKPYFFMLIFMALLLFPENASAFQVKQERDSLKTVRDSLVNLLRIKDSLLLQASIDSMYFSNIIAVLDKENDSLLYELRTLILMNKMDSVRQFELDSINRDFNRYSRWDLSDSLYNVDEDSIRSSLHDLLEVVFHDKSRSDNPEMLRYKMSRLFYHLANDSLHFHLVNGQNDTIPFVMKKDFSDSTAIFLVNAKMDSVKIYLAGNDKSTIYMWADDNFKLTQMLKKKAPPDILRRDWANINRIKIPSRIVLAEMPTNWKTGGDIDLGLNQLAFSHWARGGSNRISLLITSKGYANYTKGKVAWNNDYFYRYGLLKQEGMKLYKNTDQLRVKNTFHHKAFNNYHYSLSTQFDSQFFPTLNNPADSIPVSKFMAPATYSIGLGMVYKPSKELEITGDPLSGQFTFVLDTALINQVKYGLREDQRIKSEIGMRLNIKYNKLLWEKISLNTNFGIFRSYVNSPRPDIDWITDIRLSVNKYLSTRLYLYLKYDDDVIIPDFKYIDGVRTKVGEGKFLQVQQTFGVTFIFYL